MKSPLRELELDARFIQSHRVQPARYKALKAPVLIGVFAGYRRLFGGWRTAVLITCFMLLSLVVHLVCRTKSERYTRSSLDFVVVEEDGKPTAKRIGKYYYSAVALNAVLAIAISQAWPAD